VLSNNPSSPLRSRSELFTSTAPSQLSTFEVLYRHQQSFLGSVLETALSLSSILSLCAVKKNPWALYAAAARYLPRPHLHHHQSSFL